MTLDTISSTNIATALPDEPQFAAERSNHGVVDNTNDQNLKFSVRSAADYAKMMATG